MSEVLGFVFDKLFKNREGLSLAVVMLGFFLAQTYLREGRIPEGRLAVELLVTLMIWLAALVLHWLGTYLDNPLYGTLFGTKGKFPGVVGNIRKEAIDSLDSIGWHTEEPQETCRTMFEQSRKWEKGGKTSYEISKAARTFILPLLALLLYQIASLLCPHIPSFAEGFFVTRPVILATLLILAVIFFLGLRVKHNRALYRLVAKAHPLSFVRNGQEEKMLEIEILPGRKKDSQFQYSFYCLRDKG